MFEFAKWFEQFWNRYDKKYLSGLSAKKGAKSLAKKAAEKKVKNEVDAQRCDAALDAQKKYWDAARKANKWIPDFPMVATWFNQERWSVELDSHVELSHRPAERPKVHVATKVQCDKKKAVAHLQLIKGALK